MQFSNTTTKDGLLQDCEFWTNLGDGTITSDTTLLKPRFTGLLNRAFDEVLPIIFASDSKWQWDDPNHTKYPVAKTDLVSGQQDYSFVSDEQGNSILELSAVYVMDQFGIYQKMEAVDSQSDLNAEAIFAQNSTNIGTPRRYDKMATAIFLDPIPNYGMASGVKALFSRTQSYFVVTDTTKTPGIPNPFHRLLSLIASRDWLIVNKPDSQTLVAVLRAIVEQKAGLAAFMSKRAKDERTVLRGRVESSR